MAIFIPLEEVNAALRERLANNVAMLDKTAAKCVRLESCISDMVDWARAIQELAEKSVLTEEGGPVEVYGRMLREIANMAFRIQGMGRGI